MFDKVNVFHVFCKNLNSIRSYVKQLQTTKCRFFHKKAGFFNSKSSKNVRFRHRIALTPAKTCSTHDFTLRKQYEDKTQSSKKIMDFSIFRCPGTVEISCFQKKIRGTVLFHVGVYIFSKVTVFYVFCKNFSRIRSQVKELQTKK